MLTPLSIFVLLTAITCLLLSILIGICGKTKQHKLWALYQFCVAGWGCLVFISTISRDPETAYDLWRFSHFFGVYIAVFFFHSTCLLCNLSSPNSIKAAYIYGILNNIAHIANNGHFVFKGYNYLFNSIYYPQANILNFSIILAPWFFLILFSLYHLYRYSNIHKDNSGYQAKLWLIISIVGYTGGCSSFLPMVGITLYPTAILLLPTYALIQTYAIFKYQFLNVKVVLEKSIVYSILIAIVSIAYLAIVLTSERAVRHFIGYQSSSISLLSAFIIGIIVIPLRNKIQFFLDRSLFKGTQPEIAAENELLRREVAQSEKYKTLSTLASGVAHEVKNPLTAIKTFCEYLPQKFHDKEFLLKFSKLVGHEVDRIDGLIHDLLDYGKPAPLSLKNTDINKLIDDTLEVLSNKFIAQKTKVNKELSAPNPHIDTDPIRIKQALLNLILNAVDAMPSGGELTVQTTSGEQRFTISIADTGCGISPEDLKQIFDPFFSKKDHGTGLGLAITQSIIEEHKGKIKVISETGKGTEFIIQLPINT